MPLLKTSKVQEKLFSIFVAHFALLDPDPDSDIVNWKDLVFSSFGVSRLVEIKPFSTLRRFHSSRTVSLRKA